MMIKCTIEIFVHVAQQHISLIYLMIVMS